MVIADRFFRSICEGEIPFGLSFAKRGSGMRNGRPEKGDERRKNQKEGKRGDGSTKKTPETGRARKIKIPRSLRRAGLGR